MSNIQFQKSIVVAGASGKPMATDIFFKDDHTPKPVVVYAHGFNGFKDWGNFDIIARQFAEAGFVFIKFNFSHNGTTPEAPEAFTDLEAYGQNNYSKELSDLQSVIDWALDDYNPYSKHIDPDRLYLIGHSRGGGIVILQAASDKRVRAVTTWASVSECKTPWGSWSEEKMQEWKLTGVQYYLNARTKQQMPLYYQLHQDYVDHADRLDILKSAASFNIPLLICHGTHDEAVPVEKAYRIKEAYPAAALFTIDSDHVFGRKHPWTEDELPGAMQQVVKHTIDFLRNPHLA